MRLINVILLIFGFLGQVNCQNYLIKAHYDSVELKKAWINYKYNQSEENALKVYNLLPEKGHVGGVDSDRDLEEQIYQNLNIVYSQILNKNKNSIKLAFRSYTISDGAFTEELDIILGDLINIDPKLFLLELKTHLHLVYLSGLTCNFNYEEDLTKLVLEADKRIKSLESVNDSALIDTRDKCLKELKNFKNEFLKK
jgi:hypothetical protein